MRSWAALSGRRITLKHTNSLQDLCRCACILQDPNHVRDVGMTEICVEAPDGCVQARSPRTLERILIVQSHDDVIIIKTSERLHLDPVDVNLHRHSLEDFPAKLHRVNL